MKDYQIEAGQKAYETYIENIRRERPQNLMWQVKWSDLPEQNQRWWIVVGVTMAGWGLSHSDHDGFFIGIKSDEEFFDLSSYLL